MKAYFFRKLLKSKALGTPKSPLNDLVDAYEKKIIADTLLLFSGRVTEAASYLHITLKKIYLKIKNTISTKMTLSHKIALLQSISVAK